MIGLGKVGWTVIAVILFSFCVQWISCRAVFVRGSGYTGSTYDDNAIAQNNHKHVRNLKSLNSALAEKVKKRLRARLRGRKPDQSNERNLWVTHPKNENWSGPDTDEVYDVFPSLGV